MQNTPFGFRINLPDYYPAGELGGPPFPAKVIRVVKPNSPEGPVNVYIKLDPRLSILNEILKNNLGISAEK